MFYQIFFDKNFNSYASKIEVTVRLKEWLFLAFCIVFILYLIISFFKDSFGSIVAIILSLIFIKMTWDMCNAVNSLSVG